MEWFQTESTEALTSRLRGSGPGQKALSAQMNTLHGGRVRITQERLEEWLENWLENRIVVSACKAEQASWNWADAALVRAPPPREA